MRRRLLFRPQANEIERLAKRHNWKRLALVGVTDAVVLRRMLAAMGTISLVVVATWPAKHPQPSERMKQIGRERQVRQLCKAYTHRVMLFEGAAGEAAEAMQGEQFDGVVLFDAPDLETVGGAWALLVRSGGMLLGTDHRDLGTRAVLNAVAPAWERLDDGLWCVRVKRDAAPVGVAAVLEPVKRRPGRPRKVAA